MASQGALDGAMLLRELRLELKDPELLSGPRAAEAWSVAGHVYGNDLHRTGVRLLEHCLQVVKLLVQFKPDEDTVIAGMLHHVIDAKRMSVVELQDRFGPDVRAIVSGDYLLRQLISRPRRLGVDELRLMLIRLAEDIRSLFVFLCDRVVTLDAL